MICWVLMDANKFQIGPGPSQALIFKLETRLPRPSNPAKAEEPLRKKRDSKTEPETFPVQNRSAVVCCDDTCNFSTCHA